MRLRHGFAALFGGSLAYTSWLACRPLSAEEKEHWNAIYMEDKTLMLRAYMRAPLNAASRLWGACAHAQLPPVARRPVYGLYSRLCGCDIGEAACQDLAAYRSLSEFFRRSLRPDVRPVSAQSELVSPADGTVLHLGPVGADGRLEQVKGISYTLQGFLGPAPAEKSANSASGASQRHPQRIPDAEFYAKLKSPDSGGGPGSTGLYHCVIYLSPGDYHRFHSPANWTVASRRYFPGYLMSVSPSIAARVSGLFCLNERVVYSGRWRHGFFAFAAVGATNVGSIGIFEDSDLVTNRSDPLAPFADRQFAGFAQSKGDLFGEFDMGSTIVLLFEAPAQFAFTVSPGQKVRVGESLGTPLPDATRSS